MALPGLVAAQNLADVADRERAWDNLGLNIAFPGTENFDPDAIDYLSRVAIADGGLLELPVASAINSFIIGCKSDGIWSAIKASCILAGARTLNGALVPLMGNAPTNFNFVVGDYNRKTGLVGNGSTKYLNSNRNNNADPQDNQHLSVFVSANATGNGDTRRYISGRAAASGAGSSLLGRTVNDSEFYSRFSGSTFASYSLFNNNSFTGVTRSSSSSYSYRLNGSTSTVAMTSSAPANVNIHLFRNPSGNAPADARLAFYSIGESLDLAKLDTRVSALITAFGAAIP